MSGDAGSIVRRCRPYLQRAGELAAHEPIVSHYCRLYAVEILAKAKIGGNLSADGERLLLEELAKAEHSKQGLDLSHGRETMESFALRVFEQVDAADRHQGCDAGGAQQLYVASLFLDVCAQFYGGELPPDLAERSRYAKYRAVKVRECLRQGLSRAPPPDVPPSSDGAGARAQESGASAATVTNESANVSALLSPAAPAVASSPVAAVSSNAPRGHQGGEPSLASVKADVKKKTEFASSALDFDDVPAARQFLTEALEALQLLQASGAHES